MSHAAVGLGIAGALAALDATSQAYTTPATVLSAAVAVGGWALVAWLSLRSGPRTSRAAAMALPLVELALVGLVIWRLPSVVIDIWPAEATARLPQVTGRLDATTLAFQFLILWLIWRFARGAGTTPRSLLLNPRPVALPQEPGNATWAGHLTIAALLGTYVFRGDWLLSLLSDLQLGAAGSAARPGAFLGLACAAAGLYALSNRRGSGRSTSRQRWLCSRGLSALGTLLAIALCASVLGVVLVVAVPDRDQLMSLRQMLWQTQVVALIVLLVTDARRSDRRWHDARMSRAACERQAALALARAGNRELEQLAARRRVQAAQVDLDAVADEIALIETDLATDSALAQDRLDALVRGLRARVDKTEPAEAAVV